SAPRERGEPDDGLRAAGDGRGGADRGLGPARRGGGMGGVPVSPRLPRLLPRQGLGGARLLPAGARHHGEPRVSARVDDVGDAAGGWAGGDALPLQRRVSLGGPEVLPGYNFRQAACNQAMTAAEYLDTRVAACDRVLAVQAEYRGHISLHWSYNPVGEDEGR